MVKKWQGPVDNSLVRRLFWIFGDSHITVAKPWAARVTRAKTVYPCAGFCHADEYVALMGPSGSGKSTLMNILGCLDTPTAGKRVLNGQDVSKMPDDSLAEVRNTEIGLRIPAVQLAPRLTALKM